MNLIRNFSWNLVGSLLFALSQWGLIIIIARIGNAEMVGIYSIGLAITAPIIMFTNLQLRVVQSTSYGEKYTFPEFLLVRIIGNVVFVLIITISLIYLNYSETITWIIIIISIIRIIESFFELIYGVFQFNERLDYIAKSLILRGLIGLLIFSLLYILVDSFFMSLLVLLIYLTVLLLMYDVKNIKKFTVKQHRKASLKNIKDIIIISLPLGIVVMIASLNVNIPRVIIEKYLSFQELGYFTSVFFLNLILGKVVISLGDSILPRLSRHYKQKQHNQYQKIFLYFIVFIFAIGIFTAGLALTLGGSVLSAIYGEDFRRYDFLLTLVMIYGLFDYLSYAVKLGLNSIKCFNIQPFIELLSIIITLLLCIRLIPQYGLNGALYSLIISSFIQLAIYVIIFTIKWRKRNSYNE